MESPYTNILADVFRRSSAAGAPGGDALYDDATLGLSGPAPAAPRRSTPAVFATLAPPALAAHRGASVSHGGLAAWDLLVPEGPDVIPGSARRSPPRPGAGHQTASPPKAASPPIVEAAAAPVAAPVAAPPVRSSHGALRGEAPSLRTARRTRTPPATHARTGPQASLSRRVPPLPSPRTAADRKLETELHTVTAAVGDSLRRLRELSEAQWAAQQQCSVLHRAVATAEADRDRAAAQLDRTCHELRRGAEALEERVAAQRDEAAAARAENARLRAALAGHAPLPRP